LQFLAAGVVTRVHRANLAADYYWIQHRQTLAVKQDTPWFSDKYETLISCWT